MSALWVDTDLGFDDLVAIGLCLAGGAEVSGLSIVAGNVPLERAVLNACASAEAFGWKMPIHAGADAPLAAPLQTAAYVLGSYGMPTVGLRLPEAVFRVPDEIEAVVALEGYLRSGGRRILALGPLTNIGRLLRRAPDLAAAMQLVWMGGSFGRGNHTAVAEFNAAVDPEAADVVLRSGAEVIMVGLECCREVCVTLADLSALRMLPGTRAAILSDLFEGYVRIAANGTKPMALYDPVAAAVMLDPEIVQLQPVHIAVELDGTLTRGMTVIEWRPHKATPNARVALSPRAEDIRARFHAALRTMAEDHD